MVSEERRTGRLRIWWLAARPKTLWAGVVPVIIGGSLAYATEEFHTWVFLAALSGALFIQTGTNFANDLFDFLKDADEEGRVGPLRATQSGWVTPAQMKSAMIVTFAISVLIGVCLVIRGGMPIVIIGTASIILGILYTAGSRPLGYLGLGDILVLVFFGPVAVAGTFYVITLDMNSTVLLAGVPPGMLSTAILAVNNLRDLETDRKCGKRTMAVRFGESFARREYATMVAGGILFTLVIYLSDTSHPPALVSLLAMVAALPSLRKVMTGLSGPALNDVLASTGRILALYGLLFSIGWNL